MAECHSSVSGTHGSRNLWMGAYPNSNQLKQKLNFVHVRSCCNALANPVPQEDANADKTILHAFHRAAVDQLHVAIHRRFEDSDTEDES